MIGLETFQCPLPQDRPNLDVHTGTISRQGITRVFPSLVAGVSQGPAGVLGASNSFCTGYLHQSRFPESHAAITSHLSRQFVGHGTGFETWPGPFARLVICQWEEGSGRRLGGDWGGPAAGGRGWGASQGMTGAGNSPGMGFSTEMARSV